MSTVYSLKSISSTALDRPNIDRPSDDLFPRLSTDDEVRLEEQIGNMYSDYSMIASWSGESVACEVGNFTHRFAHELDGVLHRDLISNSQAIQVDVTLMIKATVTSPDIQRAMPKCLEKPGFTGNPEADLSLEPGLDLRQYAELPAELLTSTIESFHDGLRVKKISTFDVSCVSGSWSSDHRASLFLLVGPEKQSPPVLDIQDPVLNVKAAISQAAQQLRWYAHGPSARGGGESVPRSLDKVEGCILSYTKVPLINQSDISSTRHNSGNHKLLLDSEVILKCSGDCFAECRPFLPSSSCSDWGDPSGVLVTSHDVNRWQSAVQGMSSGGGAACGFAASCGVGECKLGMCDGEAFGASWAGTGFKFETSASNFDELKRQGTAYISACTEIIGPGCDGLVGSSKLAIIDLARPEERINPNKSIMSVDFPITSSVENRGDGEVTSWLVGEVAVVSTKNGSLSPKGPANSALARFAVQAASKIQPNLPAKSALGQDSDYLLISYPEHPLNSRHTTPPVLLLDDTIQLPIDEEGRFVISAFFRPDGNLRRLSLIQLLTGFESLRSNQDEESAFFAFGDLVFEDLSNMLSVEPTNEKQHAAEITAVLSVSDSGAVRLDDFFSYIPKCCCGGVHCQ